MHLDCLLRFLSVWMNYFSSVSNTYCIWWGWESDLHSGNKNVSFVKKNLHKSVIVRKNDLTISQFVMDIRFIKYHRKMLQVHRHFICQYERSAELIGWRISIHIFYMHSIFPLSFILCQFPIETMPVGSLLDCQRTLENRQAHCTLV